MRNVYLLGIPRQLSYDYDWIKAFRHRYKDSRLCVLNSTKPEGIENADLIVLLHSTNAQGIKWNSWLWKLERKGKLVMFTGNDYKNFEEKKIAGEMVKADLICTQIPDAPYTNKSIFMPHAMDEDEFPKMDYPDKSIRVGYRGFRYPESLGDNERNGLVDAFSSIPGVDVEWGVFPHPKVYREWLASCKATPASEAGMVGRKVISSRQFDAIGARTALIMYPGEYSGCLNDDHYIRLEKDHSNLAECLERVDDEAEWRAVTDRAAEHCRQHHTYSHRLDLMEENL